MSSFFCKFFKKNFFCPIFRPQVAFFGHFRKKTHVMLRSNLCKNALLGEKIVVQRVRARYTRTQYAHVHTRIYAHLCTCNCHYSPTILQPNNLPPPRFIHNHHVFSQIYAFTAKKIYSTAANMVAWQGTPTAHTRAHANMHMRYKPAICVLRLFTRRAGRTDAKQRRFLLQPILRPYRRFYALTYSGISQPA